MNTKIRPMEAADKAAVMEHINQFCGCYEIGTIEKGAGRVKFENRINWL